MTKRLLFLASHFGRSGPFISWGSILTLLAFTLVTVGCESDAPSVVQKVQQKQTELPPSPDGEFPGPLYVARESLEVGVGALVRGSVAVLEPAGGQTRLTLGRRARIDGDAWADSVLLDRRARISGDLSANDVSGTGVVLGETVPLTLPLDIQLPTEPLVAPGNQDIQVAIGEVRQLPPGPYGSVALGEGRPPRGHRGPAVVLLTGGVYDFLEIEFRREGAVHCLSPCDIRVSRAVNLDRRSHIGPAPGSNIGPQDIRLSIVAFNGNQAGGQSSTDPRALNVSREASLLAYVHVPNGSAVFQRRSDFVGRVVSRWLVLDMEADDEVCATVDASCDGIDDDCDGVVDDDYVEVATTCGTGQCGSTGIMRCEGGVAQDTCISGEPTASDSVCDGLDEDCDGIADEDFVERSIQCGVGACAEDGVVQCVGGSEVDACIPGEPAPDDTTCNGIDDDCDGSIDESYQPVVTSCGEGACFALGQTMCEAGGVVDQCAPGQPASSDATCDAVDDDCDGTVDEEYQPQVETCGVGACARTAPNVCLAGQVVGQCVPGTPASADTTCDGIDDDCDGQTDEDFQSQATSCGVGACATSGQNSCSGGVVVDSCQPTQGDIVDATCDGIDDDCDGTSDEDYVSYATECGEGLCTASGATSCTDGQESDSCEAGTVAANDATCDGLDNDCDGQIDEDFVEAATTCGVGACSASGVLTCQGGVLADSCQPLAPAANDSICDGLDNDCDGAVDEEYVPLATECGLGACGSSGQTSCVLGDLVDSCEPSTPASSDSTCDGLDDDCDGDLDEDYASVPTTCGEGECGATGQTSCQGGSVADSCSAGTPAAFDATCDGIDDDCDGAVDEDYLSVPTSCGMGACRAIGSTSCQGGTEQDSCSPGQPAASDATCNGVDDDCDGIADEDFSGAPTVCGVGACQSAGVEACVAGTIENSCAPSQPAIGDLTCDGIDDDCDGAVDEDFLPEATQCGIGACGGEGATACVGGAVQDSCQEGTPAADDALCDGVDDDCDGQVDEDYQSTPTACGVGACGHAGTLTCVDGSEVDDCSPLSGDSFDTTCDGVDDDCDGQVDEDYLAVVTSCGVGLCAAAGATSCVDGVEEDSCEPGTAAGDDATCDGLDNDCDGQVDEEYLARTTSCGVGACGATGETSCVLGLEEDSCTPSSPSPSDDTCDGLDDDCDGFVDEEYVAPQTTCGVGACGSVGLDLCVEGSVVDSCQPAEPAPDDASCNGQDDDCDGELDEDYQPELVSCGVGACTTTSQTECVDGAVSNACEPGEASSDDSLCNGLDDDCDGFVDEEFSPEIVSCGVGACVQQGETQCAGGVVAELCTPGVPAADDSACDGVDNDCDDAIDEDYESWPLTCGVGACAASGVMACVGGVEETQCTPGEPAQSDATCDGVDDDCSGTADEDFSSQATTCGVGACASTGSTSCMAGVESDSCQIGEAASNDSTCNGVDDDCDGTADEDFLAVATSCGVGACAASGSLLCDAGQQVDTCQEGQPAASDATCDGADDDCDGQVDEDFVTQVISCGFGECAAEGTRECVGGSVQDACAPLPPPSSTDTTCDGRDDNCNGSIDEGFVGETVSCGLGQCQRTVDASCVDGQVLGDCVPGEPVFMDDSMCDGLDEDCDGSVDEDFVATGTSCGVGACSSAGQTACQAGTVVDQCQAGTPASSDASCDGVDDDCDGQTDEDFTTSCAGDAIQSCNAGQLAVTECSNGNACDGAETCSAASCQAGTPPVIDDGGPCTVGSCDPVAGVIQTPAALGTSCGDGLICDGAGNCTGVPEITTEPQDTQVVIGQPLTLFVEATGAYLSYQWSRDGSELPGATSATFTIPAAQASDDGARFSVVVSNLTGSVVSRVATVSVGDSVGPIVELSTPPTVTTFEDPFVVTGSATDGGTGVASVWVENAALTGSNIAALISANGDFSADVPLVPGLNQLTVFAADGVGNTTTSQVLVTLKLSSAPVIQIFSPSFGSVVQTDRVDVAGVVRSSLLGSQLRIGLGAETVFPEGSSGEYDFLFEDVRLDPGRNDLLIVAETPEGSVQKVVTVFYGNAGEVDSGTRPAISVSGASSTVYLSDADYRVSGTVVADTCVQSLTVNSQSVQPIGTGGNISFDTTITVPGAGDPFPVDVSATDCFGRSSSVRFDVVFDNTAPIVSLSVPEAPTINQVEETPTRIYGSIAEPNLAGIAVGQQSVGAVPTGDGNWAFEVDVPLAAGIQRDLTLSVWDQAGNRSQHQLLFLLDSELQIEVISPTSGTEIETLSDPVQLEVVARVPGLAPGDRVSAGVDGGAVVSMGGTGDVFRATLSFPLVDGAHQLTVQALASNGSPKARVNVSFSVVNAANLPLEVVEMTPERGARLVEASQPISVTLNRPVDFNQLEVVVTETGRAKRYGDQFPGADMLSLEPPALEEIVRDNDPTPGGISPIPGDVSFVFYPNREFVYGGDVRVAISYEGETVHASTFRVRPPPTLVEGRVFDQFLEPIDGIAVALASTESTTTADGSFSFGFGKVERAIQHGSQLVTVNPNQQNQNYTSSQFFLSLQAGRLADLGILRSLRFDDGESARQVAGGAEEIPFLDGGLIIDATSAEFVFPSGASDGIVRAQMALNHEFSFPSQPGLFPLFYFVLNPIGVEVSGELSIDMSIPAFPEGSGFSGPVPRYLLISSVDPKTRVLTPAGVVEVDVEAQRLSSRGGVHAERLDVLSVAFLMGGDQSALSRYADGEITIDELRGATRAQ